MQFTRSTPSLEEKLLYLNKAKIYLLAALLFVFTAGFITLGIIVTTPSTTANNFFIDAHAALRSFVNTRALEIMSATLSDFETEGGVNMTTTLQTAGDLHQQIDALIALAKKENIFERLASAIMKAQSTAELGEQTAQKINDFLDNPTLQLVMPHN